MASINVPLGFRFVPTDEELMEFLFNKVHGFPLPSYSPIPEVEVYGYHPCFLAAGDDDDNGEEKFYFVKMKRHSKNKNGKRPSRVQEEHAYAYDDGTIGVGGWWKATSGMIDIYSEEEGNRKRTNLGFKRTLKFYSFKNNKKERSKATGTDWIMHEYNLNNTEFQEWVICGIKYKGKRSKAVGGTTKGEYLDDSTEASTTTTIVETMLLPPNENQDPIIQAGGGTEKYEEVEEKDPVRTQEEEELMANINGLLYEKDQDLNPLQDLEVNSNNIIIIEDDQNSTKVQLVSENEDLGNLNNRVVEIEQNEEGFQRHKHDEFIMSNIYGFVDQGYQNPQPLQQAVQPLETNSRITEDGQYLPKLFFENEDMIENWNSPVVAGTKQNETAVQCCEHDDWLSSLYTFVNGGYHDQNQQPLQQVQHLEADLINIEDD